MMQKRKRLKQKVVNGFKLRIKLMRMLNYNLEYIYSILLFFSYKKWLNKSKVLDKELPDSRRNRSEDRVQNDEISTAQAKPSKTNS